MDLQHFLHIKHKNVQKNLFVQFFLLTLQRKFGKTVLDKKLKIHSLL